MSRPFSTAAEIKKGYRKAALLNHPDKQRNADEATRKAAELKFKEVGEAYGVLSDPTKKAKYDAGQDLEEIEQGGGMGGMDPDDVFAAMFGGRGGFGGGGFGGGFGGGGGGGFHRRQRQRPYGW